METGRWIYGRNRGKWAYKKAWIGFGVEEFNVGVSIDAKGIAVFVGWWHVMLMNRKTAKELDRA